MSNNIFSLTIAVEQAISSCLPISHTRNRERIGSDANSTQYFNFAQVTCVLKYLVTITWLAPILQLPRPFAIVWGGITMLLGRVICGDARRGLLFAWNRLRQGDKKP